MFFGKMFAVVIKTPYYEIDIHVYRYLFSCYTG
jgi:hypothetical protein